MISHASSSSSTRRSKRAERTNEQRHRRPSGGSRSLLYLFVSSLVQLGMRRRMCAQISSSSRSLPCSIRLPLTPSHHLASCSTSLVNRPQQPSSTPLRIAFFMNLERRSSNHSRIVATLVRSRRCSSSPLLRSPLADRLTTVLHLIDSALFHTLSRLTHYSRIASSSRISLPRPSFIASASALPPVPRLLTPRIALSRSYRHTRFHRSEWDAVRSTHRPRTACLAVVFCSSA
jgi:hypothetical protein